MPSFVILGVAEVGKALKLLEQAGRRGREELN